MLILLGMSGKGVSDREENALLQYTDGSSPLGDIEEKLAGLCLTCSIDDKMNQLRGRRRVRRE